ncbi:RBBP9/YdeN family alpha/beta hydrolase [Sulfurimonas sp.]
MSKRVLILHGWGGSDYPHWQSYLASEIAKEYGCVNFLKFSNFNEPKLTLWMSELEEALHEFQPDIVVCHSLANTLWFHLCNKKQNLQEIEKLFLVAPPSLDCSVDELSEFFPLSLPERLYAKNILLIGSTNDPYMSLDELHAMQKVLTCDMQVLKNAGHINSESGYGEWPWIKEELKKVDAF